MRVTVNVRRTARSLRKKTQGIRRSGCPAATSLVVIGPKLFAHRLDLVAVDISEAGKRRQRQFVPGVDSWCFGVLPRSGHQAIQVRFVRIIEDLLVLVVHHHNYEKVVQVRAPSGNVAFVGKHRACQQGECKPQGCGLLEHVNHLSLSGSWDCRRSGTQRAGATGGTLESAY
jgi:hypothetical protein